MLDEPIHLLVLTLLGHYFSRPAPSLLCRFLMSGALVGGRFKDRGSTALLLVCLVVVQRKKIDNFSRWAKFLPETIPKRLFDIEEPRRFLCSKSKLNRGAFWVYCPVWKNQLPRTTTCLGARHQFSKVFVRYTKCFCPMVPF